MTEETRKAGPSQLTLEQWNKLLAPIDPQRVLTKDFGNRSASYLPQQEVRAHLTRIFGPAGWNMDVIETVALFDQAEVRQVDEYVNRKPTGNKVDKTYWTAGYRATVKITVKAPDGTELAHYTDSHAEECAPQVSRGDAHALALTSAVSTAMKRAATCLGDQFGLSLYNKGSNRPIVVGTWIPHPDAVAGEARAVEEIAVPDAVEEHDPDLASQDAADHEQVTSPEAHDKWCEATNPTDPNVTCGCAARAGHPEPRRTTKKATPAPPQKPQEAPEADNAEVDGFLARLEEIKAVTPLPARLKAMAEILPEILRSGKGDEIVRFNGQSMTLRAAVNEARGEV